MRFRGFPVCANGTVGLVGSPVARRFSDREAAPLVKSAIPEEPVWSDRAQLVPETTLIGEMRGEEVSYEGPDRGSQSYYVGGGVEQTFSPNLLGSVRGGYQEKTFNDDNVGNESSPYVDLAVTFVPSPATRITANVGYSLFETDIYPYASQQRTLLAASLAHDLTARISFYLSGGYTIGDYSADQSVEPGAVTDGSEDLIQEHAGYVQAEPLELSRSGLAVPRLLLRRVVCGWQRSAVLV